MPGIFNIISKLFGNKYDKDIKNIQPIIARIHQEHEKLKSITNDELREKTNALKARIEESISAEKTEIETLKSQAGDENNNAIKTSPWTINLLIFICDTEELVSCKKAIVNYDLDKLIKI